MSAKGFAPNGFANVEEGSLVSPNQTGHSTQSLIKAALDVGAKTTITYIQIMPTRGQPPRPRRHISAFALLYRIVSLWSCHGDSISLACFCFRGHRTSLARRSIDFTKPYEASGSHKSER
jgi:hypothetical protein